MSEIKYGVKKAFTWDELFGDEENVVDTFSTKEDAWEHLKKQAFEEVENESLEYQSEICITLDKDRGKASIFCYPKNTGCFFWIVSGTKDEIYLI